MINSSIIRGYPLYRARISRTKNFVNVDVREAQFPVLLSLSLSSTLVSTTTRELTTNNQRSAIDDGDPHEMHVKRNLFSLSRSLSWSLSLIYLDNTGSFMTTTAPSSFIHLHHLVDDVRHRHINTHATVSSPLRENSTRT